MSKNRCLLINPETGEKYPADILSKDKMRLVVRPEGTKIEIFMVRGDTTIPYRGQVNGKYYTVRLDW